MSKCMAAFLVLALVAACDRAGTDAAATISAGRLEARIESGEAPLILDVRTRTEYEAGHVPGAINVPHTELSGRLAELGASKDAEIVVYCRSGKRAAIAESILGEAGFSYVRHLEGDMEGWQVGGHAVTRAHGP
ncbi:MAG: rhodanese-like domain-containing protein [Deltaproteobacteria bacterium]|nr:MAG: rhodanese-like domain-containing protein [Deltaproteobacteria bacterium]